MTKLIYNIFFGIDEGNNDEKVDFQVTGTWRILPPCNCEEEQMYMRCWKFWAVRKYRKRLGVFRESYMVFLPI